MALRARQEQQQQQQQQQQQLRARCRLASHPRGCVRTEEQMKTSFMPLLYKLMYELSRSVYRATYTTAYLHANAGQGLCRGRARRCPSVCQQPPAHSLYQSRYLCHMSV